MSFGIDALEPPPGHHPTEVDARCECGHVQLAHTLIGDKGQRACRVTTCACAQFVQQKELS